MTTMLVIFLILFHLKTYAISSSVSRADYGEVKLFQVPVSYDVDTTLLLNEASRRDKEVSYKVLATLNIIPVWKGSEFEYLLKFELVSPQLHARGKHVNADYMPLKSAWDYYSKSAFFAHWKLGQIQESYLDLTEPVDIQNFKRTLISLFQFQVFDGEHNETDISGVCYVQYETISMQIIRKIKRRCKSPGWSEGDESEVGEVTTRRLTRYTLSGGLDALDELHAEELYTMGTTAAGAGLKARAFARLTRRSSAPATVALSGTLLDAISPLVRAASLIMPPPTDLSDLALQEEVQDLGELATAAGAASDEEAGEGGTVEGARAALLLQTALLRATPAQLDALLHDTADPRLLSGVCTALGAAGGARTHAAAARFLRLRQGDAPRSLALQYFAAFALAPTAQEAAVAEVLKLGEQLSDPALAQAALLAGAAAAANAPAPAAENARQALAKGLKACQDDSCRRVRLHALGNLKRDDTADLLLEYAERGTGVAALAALDALESTPQALLRPPRLQRLERVALNTSADFEVRAAALDMLLCISAPAPFALPRVLLAVHERGPRELLLLAWRRLQVLAADGPAVRNMVGLLPPRLKGWDGRAVSGTSSVLVRQAGAAEGHRALLESVQVARGGMLRRGRVRLLTLSPDDGVDETLSVEIWTKGLQAFASDSSDDAGEGAGDADEPMSGGLSVVVGGARQRSVQLFEGQAELLGHVWAGTGSSPTAVLRALRALRGAGASRPVLGGAVLQYDRRALLSLALDAQAQVSLWSRSARSLLQLRGALAGRSAVRLRATDAELRVYATVASQPRLSIAADLDFYDAIALCVRVHTSDFTRSYNVTLTSHLGAARKRVRRVRTRDVTSPGRTLALDARNDRTCATMPSDSDA